MQLTAGMLAGVTPAGGGPKHLSPDAEEIVKTLKAHYKGLGKESAAHNYSRHLKSFFSWAEGVGHNVNNLPVDAVESFLASLAAAGQKETTIYVMRTQIKAALREATNILGHDFAHMEFQTGKPVEVRKVQKAKEKQQRAERRLGQTVQQLQAIKAAQQAIFGEPVTASGGPPMTADLISMTGISDHQMAQQEHQMSDTSAPQPGGNTPQQSQQPIIVVQTPQNGRPTATIAQTNQQAQAKAAQPPRGVVINNHTFTGPFIKVSRIADGSEPAIPWGTETYVTTLPASQVAPHGDLGAFMQHYVLPMVRIGANVTTVQFVFHELNDRRQPTGRRDELVITVPAAQSGSPGMPVAPAPTALNGMSSAPTMDRATEYLLNKLDRDAEDAKKRADDLQEKMRQASDAHTAFLLQQQFQKEQDLRRQIEDDRRREQDRLTAMSTPPPPPMALTPPMPFPTILPPEPQANPAAEFAKALADSQKNMMELMLASINRPVPAPPPQKDMAEWIVPLMSQMNQQAIQQQQSNQAMLMQVMQANQQFMQALVTRESPELKLMMEQMREVRAAANAPKVDEMESFADKLQKMKMVSDMLGGGGSPNFLSDLLANADAIGEGAAKVIAAAKTNQAAPAPALNGVPQQRQMAQRQLPPAAAPTAPQAPQQSAIAPPAAAAAQLQSVVDGVHGEDDQAIVNGVIGMIQSYMQDEAPENQALGRKILATFKNAEDEGELYTLAKNLWTITGQQYDRKVAKVVAAVLAKWYSVIHQQIFGDPKELAVDEAFDESDIDGSEEGDEDESDEAAAAAVGA